MKKPAGFSEHIEEIRAKKYWWGPKQDVSWKWEDALRVVDTHPQDMLDWNRDKNRLGLKMMHERGMAPRFAKDIVKEIKDFFVDPAPKKFNDEYDKGHPNATNIAFVGIGKESGSYPRHKDTMDVFIVQVIGEIKFTIGYTEEPSDADETRILRPGDSVYIPRGTWHHIQPSVSRVTFSFGFESDADCDPSTFI